MPTYIVRKRSKNAKTNARRNARRYPDGRINVSQICLDYGITPVTFVERQRDGWPGLKDGSRLTGEKRQIPDFPEGMEEATYLPADVEKAMQRPARDTNLIFGLEAFAEAVGVGVDLLRLWVEEEQCPHFDDKPIPTVTEFKKPTEVVTHCKHVFTKATADTLRRLVREAMQGRTTYKGRVIVSAERATEKITPGSRVLKKARERMSREGGEHVPFRFCENKDNAARTLLMKWSQTAGKKSAKRLGYGECPALPRGAGLVVLFPGFRQDKGSPNAWYYEDEIRLVQAWVLKCLLAGKRVEADTRQASNGSGHGDHVESTAKKQRGRRADPDSQRRNEVCYQIYEIERLKMSLGLREASSRLAKMNLAELAPLTWTHLRRYAKEWARKQKKPLTRLSATNAIN